jgi:hypothetical protein
MMRALLKPVVRRAKADKFINEPEGVGYRGALITLTNDATQ